MDVFDSWRQWSWFPGVADGAAVGVIVTIVCIIYNNYCEVSRPRTINCGTCWLCDAAVSASGDVMDTYGLYEVWMQKYGCVDLEDIYVNFSVTALVRCFRHNVIVE